MGTVFSIDYTRKEARIVHEWKDTNEEYEALKSVGYKRIHHPNDLYQVLHAVYSLLVANRNSEYARHFLGHGYVDLIFDAIKWHPLNIDISLIALDVLSQLSDDPECKKAMLGPMGCIDALAALLPRAVWDKTIAHILACMVSITLNPGPIKFNPSVVYQRLLGLAEKYSKDHIICAAAITTIAQTLYCGVGRYGPVLLGLRGVERVCSVFSAHMGNKNVVFACAAVFHVMSHISSGRRDVVQMGGIELLVSALKTVTDPLSLQMSVAALQNSVWESPSARVRALNLGALGAIQRVMDLAGTNVDVQVACSMCLAILFSVDATFKRPERLDAVPLVLNAAARFPDTARFEHPKEILSRMEQPVIRDCRTAHVCTRTVAKNCKRHGGFMYCPECSVPQFMFRCLTCKDCGDKVFCLSCKERCHKGHKGETFFIAAGCDCVNNACCSPPEDNDDNAAQSPSSDSGVDK